MASKQKDDWLLYALVSAAAGFPAGMSNTESNGSQDHRDRETAPAHLCQPRSLRRKLRRSLAICRLVMGRWKQSCHSSYA